MPSFHEGILRRQSVLEDSKRQLAAHSGPRLGDDLQRQAERLRRARLVFTGDPHLRTAPEALPARALQVYDVHGRLVRTLIDQDAAPGTFRAAWDGRTDAGASAGRGVFFARMTADGGVVDTRKVILE